MLLPSCSGPLLHGNRGRPFSRESPSLLLCALCTPWVRVCAGGQPPCNPAAQASSKNQEGPWCAHNTTLRGRGIHTARQARAIPSWYLPPQVQPGELEHGGLWVCVLVVCGLVTWR
uniref:Uncharacterized protein n=1 Tax=Micrurus spixii TaxID=129469 RepID=A0A2D4LU96_9SAUR